MEYPTKNKTVEEQIAFCINQANDYIKQNNIDAEIKYYDPNIKMFDNEVVMLIPKNYKIFTYNNIIKENYNVFITFLIRKEKQNEKS